MKLLKYTLVTMLAFLLVSCYEVNEEIVINEDGSGSYVTKMDMGQLLEMLQTFGGEEELTKGGLDRAIDTTILMSTLADSATTAEQKELLKDGKMDLKMDIKEKLFKINMNLPYKNYNSLQKLMAGQGNGGSSIANVFKNFFGGNKPEEKPAPDGPKDPDMSDLANIYDVTVKNGLISKKVNAEKFKALTSRPEMEQFKQIGSSGMEVLYTTTIKLPRPVKKVDNQLIKLSEDKKTVTFKYNLLEMLETPDKFSYTIEY